MTPIECARIMVIDDEAGIRQSTKRMLERQGYAVAAHDGGPGCFSEVAHFKPDLVLVDVNMPFLSGDAFISLFGNCPAMAEASLVLFSGMDDSRLQQKVIECSAHGCISKTESTLEFARKIASFLRMSSSAMKRAQKAELAR